MAIAAAGTATSDERKTTKVASDERKTTTEYSTRIWTNQHATLPSTRVNPHNATVDWTSDRFLGHR
jgi:hypothetical protein